MIDHKIILNIINERETTPETQCGQNKKSELSSDSRLIFFPMNVTDYNEKVNALDAVQYLQRIRLLYTMLLRSN